MNENDRKNRMGELIRLAVDCMEVAVTITDKKGTLLYYNRYSTTILDRKPEYIGTDIRSHHKKADSNEKVNLMLKEFENGRKEPFYYQAIRYGKLIAVTISPIIKNDEFVGCVQTVRLKENLSENQ